MCERGESWGGGEKGETERSESDSGDRHPCPYSLLGEKSKILLKCGEMQQCLHRSVRSHSLIHILTRKLSYEIYKLDLLGPLRPFRRRLSHPFMLGLKAKHQNMDVSKQHLDIQRFIDLLPKEAEAALAKNLANKKSYILGKLTSQPSTRRR